MEKIEEYRHFVDKKTKEIFLKSFKSAINKVDKDKFSFIGIVGSIEKGISHDVDVLIFPNIKTKIGEAIIEIAKLYEVTEKELKKQHKRYYIVACPKFAMQEMTHHLAAIEEGASGMIPLHSMFFTNYRDFKKFSPKKWVERIKEKMITIHGDFEKTKKIPTLAQSKLEPYFFILDFEMNSRIKNFPRHLIRASAESLFEYLEKKYDIKVKKEVPHDIKELNKEFIRLMKLLDKKTYS